MDDPSSKETPKSIRPLPSNGGDANRKEIVKRLLTLAAATRETPHPDQIEVIVNDLSDLSPGEVVATLERLRKTEYKFPAVAKIRDAVLGGSQIQVEDAKAEAAWMEAEKWVMANFDPDNGVRGWISPSGTRCTRGLSPHWKQIPPLPARTEHALRAIGGYERVWYDVQGNQYTWLKREFVDAWKRAPKVREALAINAAERKQLPPGFARIVEIVKSKLGMNSAKRNGSAGKNKPITLTPGNTSEEPA